MLWDTLKINGKEAWVIQNTNITKFQKVLLYIIPIVGIIICIGIILNEDSNWKYLSIVACIFFFLLYKYYYLPLQEIGDYILQIQQNRMVYVEPGVKYIISLDAIAEIKNESVYFDFRGRGNSYWEHKIMIKIKNGCQIIQIYDNEKEKILKGNEKNSIIVEVSNMNLKHIDHEKLFGYMLNVIENNKF